MKILVTGATGQLGGQTIEFLLDRVAAGDVAALARDPARLAHLAERGVDVRQGDYFDRASLERAFAGIDKLLLVSTTSFTDMITQHRNAIGAAAVAGVRHIHYAGIQRREGSGFEMPQVSAMERATEAALAASGMAVTLLRNPLYLDVLPFMFGDDVFETGIRAPAGRAPAALATRRDLAEANAAVLAGEGHAGRIYALAGSEAVTMADAARIVAKAAGRPVDYVDVPVGEYVEGRMAAGLPGPVARFLAGWFEAIAAGEFGETSGDLERLLGRPPVSPSAFLGDAYRTASRKAA